MRQMLFLSLLFLTGISANLANAQSNPGIKGHYWLAGYEANYKYGQGKSQSPSPVATRLQHKWYVERLISPRTNAGLAFTHSIAQIEFNQFAYNYTLYAQIIEVSVDDKIKYLQSLKGTNELKTMGYELFAKRYFNTNPLRNYGWYVTYKYGRLYLSDRILKGATIIVDDPGVSYPTGETYAYNSDEVHRSKLSYIGIDLGKTYPLYHSRLLFSTSFSYNIFFNKTKTDNSFDSHLNKMAGRHVARRHMPLWNLGIAYVL